MKSIEIDRSKMLKDDPGKGHNRWHPDITPILEVDPGEEVSLETRDASDGQMNASVTVDDFPGFAGKVGHPLTGPVYIKGAEPGDLLEIEYVDIIPQPYGWTRNRPGAGFLRDLFPDPFVAHWEMSDGWATSKQVPGVRIPVVHEDRMLEEEPDYALMLSWNMADFLIPKFRTRGYKGKFIMPVPKVEIIE